MRHLNVTSLFAAAALLAAGFEPLANGQSAGSPLNHWTQSAALSAPRAQACAAVLNDGRLLVMGGLGQSGAVATVDVYGADGSFTPGVPMTQPRANAGCVTMSDGRVLVAGGNGGSGTLRTAEIFSPATNQWTPTGNLNVAREGHTMAVTGWGVWVAGGTNNGTINGALELFNPVTGQFLTVGSLNTPRAEFAMAPQGRNLVIAGGTDGTNTLSSVEVYDSALGTVTVAGSMSQARKDFAAAALLDGTVLMTGGLDANGVALSTSEFFDPVKGTSLGGPALLAARSGHTAYAMPNNGSVLIYGGAGISGVLDTAEIYTPWNGTIAQTAPLNNARQYEAKATLRPGHYFVAGGRNDAGLVAGSELYQFSTIATDKGDYAPGTAVKISGTGWVPGEQVLVTITAYPVDQHHIEFTGAALADGAGNITVPGFAVDKSHLGMKFLMSAVGSQSQAQTTFNDQNVPTITYSFSPPLASLTPNSTLTVTVTITGGAGTPTGTITPTDNSTVITSATGASGTTCTGGAGNQCTLIAGVANLSYVVTQGAHAFSVFYSGDTNYDSENPGNNSPIQNFNVQSPTFTSLSGPASPVTYGSQSPYTATVCTSSNGTSCSNAAGDLTGSVQFSVDGTVEATVPVSGQNVVTGMATASFVPSPPLTVTGSPHSIIATYGSDSSWSNSTSNTVMTSVSAQAAPFTLSVSGVTNGGTVSDGALLTFTATYSGSTTPPPGGTVTFYNSAKGTSVTAPICTSPVTDTGTFTCSATSMTGGPAGLAPGAVTLAITYTPDTGNYTLGATSPAFTFTITAATSITLTATQPDLGGASTYIGDTVTLKAVVTATNNHIIPGGTVTFTLPANSSTTCTPNQASSSNNGSNSATYMCTFVAAPPAGGVAPPPGGTNVTASASYTGDALSGNSGPATSNNINLQQDPTTTTVTLTGDSPAPTYVGHTVTITAKTSTTNNVKPDWTKIAIAPPAANSPNAATYPLANTCASPTHNVALDTAESVTVTCTFVLTGPLGTGNITASAAYAAPNGDATTGTATSNGTSSNLAIALDTTAITVTQASDDSPAATQVGRTVVVTVTVTNQIPNAFLPNGNPILPVAADTTITPFAGNSADSTCTSANWSVASNNAAENITITCSYLLTGPFPGTLTTTASYSGDSVSTAASGPVTSTPLSEVKANMTTTPPALTITSLDCPAGCTAGSSIQLGRVVTLTATVKTPSNGRGVDVMASPTGGNPTGTITFTLPANEYGNASCGTNNGNNTFTVAPTWSSLTYNPAGPNQTTGTAVCSFTLLPSPAKIVAHTLYSTADTYSFTYSGDSLTTSTPATSQSTNVIPAATTLTTTVTPTSTSLSSSCATPYSYYYGQQFVFSSTLSSLTTLPYDGALYSPSQGLSVVGTGGPAPVLFLPALTPVNPASPAPPASPYLAGTSSLTVPSAFAPSPAPGCYTFQPNYSVAPPGIDSLYSSPNPPAITVYIQQESTTTIINSLTTTASGQPDIEVFVVPQINAAGSPAPTGTVEIVTGNSPSGGVIATAPLTPATNCTYKQVIGTTVTTVTVPVCSTSTFTIPGGTYGAVYPGNADFGGSNTFAPGGGAVSSPIVSSSSVTLCYFINGLSPCTPVPPVVPIGDTVTIQATVTGTNGSAQPTGSVTLYDNGNLIGVQSVVQGGIATLPSFTPQPGPNSLVVTYSGDSTYPPFTISAVFNVSKVMVQVTSNIPATGTVGQPITLGVRLAGPTQGAALPTGTVTFYDNGAQIGTPATISNGVGTLTLSNGLSAGQNNISISYSGDVNYASLAQNIGTINVGAAQPVTTTTTLTVTVNGTQMTLTATVAPSGSATGTPTGTVQFVDTITGAVLATATLSNGTATTTIPLTTDSIVAIYSGDTTFMASTSAPSETISVTNAASYVPAFSPGEIATVFGSNLTTQTITGTLPLTDSLGGVTVTVTDSAGAVLPASIFYVSPSQLSFLIPPTTALGTATVTVTTANGSLTSSINLTASTAALFTANANGKGPLAAQVFDYPPSGAQPTYVDTATLSGTTFVNAPLSLSPTTDSFYLYLYGTGFDNGKSVMVTINGQTFTPVYFGPQGTYAGLDQINVLLPQSLANAGPVNVSITVDGQVSNVGTIQFGSGGTN